jgi:hypothetical protein
VDPVVLLVGALLAALVVGLAVRRPNAARALIALIFAGGALLNAVVFLPRAEPALLALVATSPVPLHREVVAAAVGVSAVGFMLLVVAFEAAVARLTLGSGPSVNLGLAAAALWCVAMLPVVPPHAWLGSALAMGAVAAAAVILTRHRFDNPLFGEIAHRLSGPRSGTARPG